jgi:hypothetical protein
MIKDMWYILIICPGILQWKHGLPCFDHCWVINSSFTCEPYLSPMARCNFYTFSAHALATNYRTHLIQQSRIEATNHRTHLIQQSCWSKEPQNPSHSKVALKQRTTQTISFNSHSLKQRTTEPISFNSYGKNVLSRTDYSLHAIINIGCLLHRNYRLIYND